MNDKELMQERIDVLKKEVKYYQDKTDMYAQQLKITEMCLKTLENENTN